MSRCCSVSFSISFLCIFSFLAQLSAGGHTLDQNSSIPLPDIVEFKPNSSVIDTYSYFCHDYNTTQVFAGFVQCNPQMRKVVVPPLYCLNYNEEMSMFLAGTCPFLPNAKEIKSVYLPENFTNVATFNEEVMCQDLNRKGVSCGKCNDHSAVAINSYSLECMNIEKCHNYNLIFVLLADLVPVTLLFLIVILFDINIISGYANMYILFSQIVSLQINVLIIAYQLALVTQNYLHATYITLTLVPFYSIWSLDLGRILTPNVCVGHLIETIDSIALQYMSAFYGLGLVFITYCIVELHGYNFRLIVWLWKPFSKCFTRIRRRVNPSASLINAFATFLVLSYSKLAFTSIVLLTPSYLYNQTGHHVSTVLIYDGTLGFFKSKKHIWLAILAILIFTIFVILPPLLLLLYPWRRFQRFLSNFRLHRPGLIIFMDTFQGCYKDGSNGTRDCRCFSAFYFILRIIMCVVYVLLGFGVFSHLSIQLIIQGVYTISILILLYLKPYKKSLYNNLDITILLDCILIWLLYLNSSIITNSGGAKLVEMCLFIALGLPLLGAVVFVTYHLIKRLRFCTMKTKRRIRHAGLNSRLSLVIDEKFESQERDDLTPSLPDRLLHPHLYSEFEEQKVNGSTYGSIGPAVP